MKMIKTPQSQFEKLLAGLTAMKPVQPAAKLRIEGNKLLVGSTDDPFVTEGMKIHLVGLGFEVDENTKQFAFRIKSNEQP
jgi:hypothetical protein